MKIFNCRIPSNVNEICSMVEKVISCFQQKYGEIDKCNLFEIKVILNELILNAIKHGNKGEENKFVRIAVGLSKRKYFVLTVEDDGKGFDHNCLVNKNKHYHNPTNICDIKETGRGILIVKNLCDGLKFNRKGNKVLVIKRLNK